MGSGAGAAGLFGGIFSGIGRGLVERARRKDELRAESLKGALSAIANVSSSPNFNPEWSGDMVDQAMTAVRNYSGTGEKVATKPGGKANHAQDPLTAVQQFLTTTLKSGAEKMHKPSQSPEYSDKLAGDRAGPEKAAETGKPGKGPLFLSQKEREEIKLRQDRAAEEQKKEVELQYQEKKAKLDFDLTKQQRHEIAMDAGLKPGTTEYQHVLVNGVLPLDRTLTGTPRVFYGTIKGQEDQGMQVLTFNPKDPAGGFIDAGGKSYRKEEITGVSNTPPPAQRMFGRTLEISKYVESKGWKPGSPEYNYYFGLIAGADLQTSIGRIQQTGAIAGYESGIGMGQGFPAVPDNPNKGKETGSKPELTSKVPGGTASSRLRLGTGIPDGSAATPGAAKPRLTPKAATAAPGAPGAPKRADNANDRFVSMYLGSLFGDSGAMGGAAKVGVIKGREELKRVTGLTGVDFSMLEASTKDQRKAFSDTIQRAVATQRVNEVVQQFGEEVLIRAKSALQTGSPFLNKPIRFVLREAVGNPDLQRFLLALNGFQRQYSVLTAGSPQSRAMLPISVGEKVDKILDPNSTIEEVIASVEQVKIEGRREADGFKNAAKDVVDQISGSLKPHVSGSSSKYQPGDPVKLKDGRTVIIKKINADGTFDY